MNTEIVNTGRVGESILEDVFSKRGVKRINHLEKGKGNKRGEVMGLIRVHDKPTSCFCTVCLSSITRNRRLLHHRQRQREKWCFSFVCVEEI